MDSHRAPPSVRLELFFPQAEAALPSARNRCLVVGPRGSGKSALLLNYCCRAALAEADPGRRRALLIASRAHLEREPLPPAPRARPQTAATTALPPPAAADDPSALVDVKYVEDVQGLKAVGAALHTYRPPGQGYACVAVLGLSGLLRHAGGGGGGAGAADVAWGAAPDAGGGGGSRASRDREVTRALALLCDAADSQGCVLIVADDALSTGSAGGGGGASPPPGGFGGGGGYESPVAAALSPASSGGAPAAGFWAQRWFPVTLALSEAAGGEFVMRAVGGGGGGGGGGTTPGGPRHGGGGGLGGAAAGATTLPAELSRVRVRYSVAASGEVAVVSTEQQQQQQQQAMHEYT